jgi:hypothetical protein
MSTTVAAPRFVPVDAPSRIANGDQLLAELLANSKGFLIRKKRTIIDGKFASIREMSIKIHQDWMNDCYDAINAAKRYGKEHNIRFEWERDFKETGEFRIWRKDAVRAA